MLLYVLICLVILLIGSVAVIRSFQTSMFNAGNLAFKRDLVNQGERARVQVMTLLTAGALSTDGSRQASAAASNYSAVVLPSNPQGIPNALLASDADFGAVGSTGNDISVPDQRIDIRWVLDRQCSTTGQARRENCILTEANPAGTDSPTVEKLEQDATGVVYRLTIRVRGPRNTQAFLQSTFSL